jgi:hypothetical protein
LSGQILGTSPAAVTLAPGVYCFGSSAQLTGTLTLSGNGVYIFQIGSTLTTATNSAVVLANGAVAGNVFWQVGSSATLGTNTAFVGSILAFVSDTVTAGSSVAGRVFSLSGAVTLDTNEITPTTVVAGRWQIVHTSGDNTAQTFLYPGGFSTFLREDGTGYTYGTFSFSVCVINAQTYNVVPAWVAMGGNNFQISITVDNLGVGPNFSFIYNGTYDPLTPVPGNSSEFIPAITGTYYATGDASACSLATQNSPGNFVATFLPTISSGSAIGSLDGFTADNGSAFDSTLNSTITFSAPPAPGQIAGTVSLASNPTFNYVSCFATTNGIVNPLTINPNRSSQSGVVEYMFAEGLDPDGVPTTLFLNSFSADLYNTDSNTDPNAAQVAATEWAAPAAIGVDNPAVGVTGVSNDGTNNVMVQTYGVLGGACDHAGGVDSPFHFQPVSPSSQGSLPATATLSASSMTFTPLLVGSNSTAQLATLTNNGQDTLAIANIGSGGTNATDFAVTSTCGILLAPGAHCSISTTFTPTASGTRAASIAITDSASSSPQSVSLQGTGQDFSLTLDSSSTTTGTGDSANLQLTVTPIAGFTQAVALTCSGAPLASCTVTPSNVTPKMSVINVTVTLIASGGIIATRHPKPLPTLPPPISVWKLMLLVLFVLVLACSSLRLSIFEATREVSRPLVFGGSLMLLSLVLSACSGALSRPVTSTSSMPSGMYTITISGRSGSLTRTIAVQMTVPSSRD